MAKQYNINVPIQLIQPAEQIIDYFTGKAQLFIGNPWFEVPGVPKVPFPTFLPLKQLPGPRPGQQITSPQIYFKTQAGTFTNNITFTDDDGSNSLPTVLRFYSLPETPLTLADYSKKFKVLQKVPASRGTYADTNTTMINECVINYQLTQAFEMALVLKMLCIAPQPEWTDLITLQTINTALGAKQEQRINDYIAFNKPPQPGVPDQRYIKQYNAAMAVNFVMSGPVKQSIINIFAQAIEVRFQMNGKKQYTSSEQDMKQQQYDTVFQSYAQILRSGKYQSMDGACYVKEYEGNANNQQYKGQSFYTDYILKIADKSTSKTMKKTPQMSNIGPMTVADYFDLISADNGQGQRQVAQKSIAAKIFMGVDFDFRVYPAVTKQAIHIRYIIHLIFYKPNVFNSLANIDYSTVDMGVDSGMGGMDAGINFDSIGGVNDGFNNTQVADVNMASLGGMNFGTGM